MKLYEALAEAMNFDGAIVSEKHPNRVLTVHNDRLLITRFYGDVDNCDYDEWHLANTPTLEELNEDGYSIHLFHGFDTRFYETAIAFSIKSALQNALMCAERIESAPTELMLSEALNKIIKEASNADALAGNALCLLTNKGDFKPVSVMVEEGKACNKAIGGFVLESGFQRIS